MVVLTAQGQASWGRPLEPTLLPGSRRALVALANLGAEVAAADRAARLHLWRCDVAAQGVPSGTLQLRSRLAALVVYAAEPIHARPGTLALSRRPLAITVNF